MELSLSRKDYFNKKSTIMLLLAIQQNIHNIINNYSAHHGLKSASIDIKGSTL